MSNHPPNGVHAPQFCSHSCSSKSTSSSRWTQTNRDKISNHRRGKERESEKVKLGITNHGSRHGLIRSPRGLIYEFNNLAQFVRDNEKLFMPEDVVWIKPKNKIGTTLGNLKCRALSGLYSLINPRTTKGSWKGWTVVSLHERRFNDGNDLLARNSTLQNHVRR